MRQCVRPDREPTEVVLASSSTECGPGSRQILAWQATDDQPHALEYTFHKPADQLTLSPEDEEWVQPIWALHLARAGLWRVLDPLGIHLGHTVTEKQRTNGTPFAEHTVRISFPKSEQLCLTANRIFTHQPGKADYRDRLRMVPIPVGKFSAEQQAEHLSRLQALIAADDEKQPVWRSLYRHDVIVHFPALLCQQPSMLASAVRRGTAYRLAAQKYQLGAMEARQMAVDLGDAIEDTFSTRSLCRLVGGAGGVPSNETLTYGQNAVRFQGIGTPEYIETKTREHIMNPRLDRTLLVG